MPIARWSLEDNRKYKFVMQDPWRPVIYSMLLMITFLLICNYALAGEKSKWLMVFLLKKKMIFSLLKNMILQTGQIHNARP